jgi:hypothetical protein
MMSVQALCDRLVANDAALTELIIALLHVNDAEVKLILDAAKKNKTVQKVLVIGSHDAMRLSVPVALSLASVISEHPEIQEIEIHAVEGLEFAPLALAIQQNRKLTRLLFVCCRVTTNHVECIRWLLTQNALESLTLMDSHSNDGEDNHSNDGDDIHSNDGEASFDISGALLGNSASKSWFFTTI